MHTLSAYVKVQKQDGVHIKHVQEPDEKEEKGHHACLWALGAQLVKQQTG